MKRNKKKPDNTANPYSPRTVWVLAWIVPDDRALTCLDSTSYTEGEARKKAAKAWANDGFLNSSATICRKFNTTVEALAFVDSFTGLMPNV